MLVIAVALVSSSLPKPTTAPSTRRKVRTRSARSACPLSASARMWYLMGLSDDEDEDEDDDNDDAPVVFSRPLLVCVPSDEDS